MGIQLSLSLYIFNATSNQIKKKINRNYMRQKNKNIRDKSLQKIKKKKCFEK